MINTSMFNENTRVKIPAILHLIHLGYDYLSLKNQDWDKDTNIFPQLFIAAISKINPNIPRGDGNRILADLKLLLDNEDLGKAFFERLTNRSQTKLIDFENFNNNSFHVVTELHIKTEMIHFLKQDTFFGISQLNYNNHHRNNR
ncbi:type I restriction endonuclease [Candidatus Nitrosacidococcus sp. I8]|uniref:type I restriction endonuclease n=1 Tax=Candidatus Nitrosacidococcus sp. I8 TaxID=2942908 RepID=UPI002226F0BA|nr:type I restriction endonuclease [Candidatus Nitrosacidococcus sp. I8]CAH9019283.1 hypothetical protein NURINAE_01446 [Candidatus Nitrosacidococcus sp. I8]